MAAVGVMAYPVRDSFHNYQAPTQFAQSRTHPAREDSPAMSGANTSHYRTLASQSSSSTPASEDASRMSLPSISNLLGIADASRPARAPAPTMGAADRPGTGYDQRATQYEGPPKRARYDHGYGHHRGESFSNNPYATQDNSNHASKVSPYTRYSPVMDRPQLAMSIGSANAMEIDQQTIDTGFQRHLQSQPNSHLEASFYPGKPYAPSPDAASDGSLYSPSSSMHRQMGLYGAQGMPPGYARSDIVGASQSTPNLPATSQWEHHHYISSTAPQALYPPLPDRYICQTCNKPFSRPSSLKIHTHSHTGEKPFKCPHAGCRKAFSVKSNMKRHEKGCHGEAVPGASIGEDA